MEKLASNVVSEILPERPRKDIYLCSSETIESLIGRISPGSHHFGFLLAVDARSLNANQIGQLAEDLLAKGLAYLCAWGPDCERVHEIFDEVDVDMDPEQNGPVVLTTWHKDQTLQEALSFFVNSAFPDEAYERNCHDWIIAQIDHPEWEQIVRAEFERFAENRRQ